MPKSDKEIITSYGSLKEKVNVIPDTDRSMVICNSRDNIIICWVYLTEGDSDDALPEMMDSLKRIILKTVENIEYGL